MVLILHNCNFSLQREENEALFNLTIVNKCTNKSLAKFTEM